METQTVGKFGRLPCLGELFSAWKRCLYLLWLLLLPLSGNAATPMIATGGSGSLFLNGDGSVWGAGRVVNYSPGAVSPVRSLQLTDIVSVAACNGTQFALRADGTLWGFGNNNFGQLGDGTTQSRSEPQRVPGLSVVTAVATDCNSTFALTQDGTVWAWGANANGQLGDGTQNDRSVPAQVLGLTTITQIAAAASSALALRADGTVWVWGSTSLGSAGDGTNSGLDDPASNRLLPTQVHIIDQAVAISAGFEHHLALHRDGTVWTWGKGGNGENGTGAPGLLDHQLVPVQIPDLDHVVAIDAKGTRFSLALKSDGTVWAWGLNNYGQLGSDGMNYSASPIQVPGVTDIDAIAAGFQHALALRRDGAVFAWGGNESGQLGDNTLQARAQALAVSGPGGTGQLNLTQPAPAGFNQLPSAQINQSSDSGTAPLTVQFSAANATDADGTVTAFSWKSGDGQQASGDTATFVFAQAGTYTIDLLVVDNAGASGWAQAWLVVSPAAAAAAQANPKVGLGQESGMALTNDGRILTWGDRNWLGLYDTSLMYSLPAANALPMANGITGAVDITVGGGDVKHVLLADGTVFGWGQNGHGEVGSGIQGLNTHQPQLLSGLPPVQALAAGFSHEFALTSDGRVFAWGENTFGQLGVGDTTDRYQPTEVPGLTDVVALIGGYRFSAALKSDGTVWAWGDNTYSQLGDGTQTSSNRPIQVPGLSGIAKIFPAASALFAQEADGTVWATGGVPFTPATNVQGTNSGAYRVPDLDNARQIVGSNQHILVLKADGTVWSGGVQGNLALGYQNAGDMVGLRQIPGVSDAVGLITGGNNSAVLRRDGTVLAWGLNNNGQVGDGTLAQRTSPVLVVNETSDGFLDLIPGTDFELPPSVGVPFFAVASGGISNGSATVYTRAKFNGGDVGKSGKVFVTAAVPPGSLVAASSPMSASGASSVRANSSAATSTSSFVLVNLTDTGWKPVTGGQLLPYASGVLGDQLSAQTILDNTDTTNLKGAQFCLGYGTSAEQMVATGRMRVVASIPDPSASGAAAVSCLVAGPPVSYGLALPQGWSLLGNSLNQALTVSSLFNDANSVTSVWKWDANTFGWQFYTPSMDAAALQTYATSKGYAVLAAINPGEGYWVNAKAQPTIGTQSGDSFILTGMNLAKGWNLVATGNDITPTEFNANLKASAVPASLKTLWAWDSPAAKWFFYAPSLETQGGTALSGYIANKGYLDFATTNKKLGNGTGFWVSR